MEVMHYRDLEVWQEAMNLAEACYEVTRAFPRDEVFGMTSQIRRAAMSVPANIAEGHGRTSTREFLNFLSIARGSLMELETHLLLAQQVGLLPEDKRANLLEMTTKVSQMLSGLRKALLRKLAEKP